MKNGLPQKHRKRDTTSDVGLDAEAIKNDKDDDNIATSWNAYRVGVFSGIQ